MADDEDGWGIEWLLEVLGQGVQVIVSLIQALVAGAELVIAGVNRGAATLRGVPGRLVLLADTADGGAGRGGAMLHGAAPAAGRGSRKADRSAGEAMRDGQSRAGERARGAAKQQAPTFDDNGAAAGGASTAQRAASCTGHIAVMRKRHYMGIMGLAIAWMGLEDNQKSGRHRASRQGPTAACQPSIRVICNVNMSSYARQPHRTSRRVARGPQMRLSAAGCRCPSRSPEILPRRPPLAPSVLRPLSTGTATPATATHS